jgi:hypothetical protein
MGYRSEVAIAMTRPFFAKVMEIAPDATKQMIEWADSFKAKDDAVMLYWNWIKWYKESDSSVGKLWSQLFKNDSDDFYCLEIGEDTNHIVEEGGLWDNPWLTSVQRSIYIEDCGKDVELDAFQ